MTACEIISKHYNGIHSVCIGICKDNGEDLCHDLIEYFLKRPEKIERLEDRDVVRFFQGAAYRQMYQKNSAYNKKYNRKIDIKELQILDELINEEVDPIDLGEIINELDLLDMKILAIFAVNQNVSDISRRTLIERHTLKRLIDRLKTKIHERRTNQGA